MYGHMITKISRMNRQTNFLSYGALYNTVKIFEFVYMHKNNSNVFSLTVTKYALL